MNNLASAGVGLLILLVIVGLYGWVVNIVDLVAHAASAPLGMVLARIAGIFIPVLGAALGLFA